MIHVKRPPLPPSKLLDQARKETESLVKEYDKLRAAFRDAFKAQIWMEFRPELVKLFHGKCAYCETPILASSRGGVEHFRPKRDAAEDRSSSDPAYYFWLAYEWRNLLIACQMCNTAKRNTFPVVRNQRSTIGDSWEKVTASEQNLILDPCRDEPAEFLEFRKDGLVYPRAVASALLKQRHGGQHPGEVSIRVLNLNREGLIFPRKTHAEQILLRVQASASMKELLAPSQPYLALTRDVLGLNREDSGFESLQPTVRPTAKPVKVRTSVDEQPPLIDKIEIRNFKLIESLDLTLDGRSMAILGENAVGKTTVLRALALAFVGENRLKKEHPNGSGLLRRLPSGKLADSGSIKITFSLTHDPIELHFNGETIAFESGAKGLGGYCRAYGNVRLPGEKLASKTEQVSVENLFNPRTEITNAHLWLAAVPLDAQERVGVALRTILMLADEDRIEFGDSGFRIRPDNTWVEIPELSSGYQDIFHILADTMRGFQEKLTNFENATGIVLVDELGNSLHPKWKMQIVPLLRKIFPKMQLIISTHDPLCLKGFDVANILVLAKNKDKRVVCKQARTSVKTLRVDQILTSELFGLSSTIDPDAQTKFDEYYELLAKDNPTPDDVSRREKLRRELAGLSNLPASLRDQKIFEIVDEFLARRDFSDDKTLEEQEKKVREAVYERWLHLTGGDR